MVLVEMLQAAMESQQSQLNLILEAVKSNPPAVPSSSDPFSNASVPHVCWKQLPLPAEEVSASQNCPAVEGARVSWGCSKSKTSRRKAVQKSRNGCLVPSSGGAIMKDVQSCGMHPTVNLLFPLALHYILISGIFCGSY